jgi:hypothetical protein
MVTTTELNERAGARRNTGEKREGSRRGLGG